MKCPYCKKEIDKNDTVCHNCGLDLREARIKGMLLLNDNEIKVLDDSYTIAGAIRRVSLYVGIVAAIGLYWALNRAGMLAENAIGPLCVFFIAIALIAVVTTTIMRIVKGRKIQNLLDLKVQKYLKN